MPRLAIPAVAKLLLLPVTMNFDPVILTFELDLHMVKMYRRAKYLVRRSLVQKLLSRGTDTPD